MDNIMLILDHVERVFPIVDKLYLVEFMKKG